MTHSATVDTTEPHHTFDNQHSRDFLPLGIKYAVREPHSKQIGERVANLSFYPNGTKGIIRIWAEVSENAQ
jgi:hypothetical protein